MNKKASNNLSVMEIVYVLFWSGIVMALVYWLWPLLIGVLTVVFNFSEMVSGF